MGKQMLELKEAGKKLLEGQNIALTVHVSPDGDAIGSVLGLARILTGLGKNVTIFVDDIIKGFNFLPDVDKIKTETNLEGIKEPLRFDLLCVLDCSTLERIGRVADCIKADHVLNIDHHASNEGFAEFSYIDENAAATAEILCELLETMQWELDALTATYLYVGLSTDSGSFRYSNTTGKTMRCGAMLVEAGAKPNEINEALDVMSKPTMAELLVTLPTLTYVDNGRIAYMYVDNAHYDKNAVTDYFVNYCRNIEGVQVALFFKEVAPNEVRVSMRSTGMNLAEVAVKFGGGGHHRAAGCTVKLPLQQAIATVLSEIKKQK